MKLVLADIERQPLDDAVAELRGGGAEAVGVLTDVSRLEQVEALAAAALDAFGAVHVLCNNAGIGRHGARSARRRWPTGSGRSTSICGGRSTG